MQEEKCKHQERWSKTEFATGQLMLQGRHRLPPLLCWEAAGVATKFWETLLMWKLLDSNFSCLKASLLDTILPVWCYVLYNSGCEELYCA